MGEPILRLPEASGVLQKQKGLVRSQHSRLLTPVRQADWKHCLICSCIVQPWRLGQSKCKCLLQAQVLGP